MYWDKFSLSGKENISAWPDVGWEERLTLEGKRERSIKISYSELRSLTHLESSGLFNQGGYAV